MTFRCDEQIPLENPKSKYKPLPICLKWGMKKPQTKDYLKRLNELYYGIIFREIKGGNKQWLEHTNLQ